jgi:hypothetical protein
MPVSALAQSAAHTHCDVTVGTRARMLGQAGQCALSCPGPAAPAELLPLTDRDVLAPLRRILAAVKYLVLLVGFLLVSLAPALRLGLSASGQGPSRATCAAACSYTVRARARGRACLRRGWGKEEGRAGRGPRALEAELACGSKPCALPGLEPGGMRPAGRPAGRVGGDGLRGSLPYPACRTRRATSCCRPPIARCTRTATRWRAAARCPTSTTARRRWATACAACAACAGHGALRPTWPSCAGRAALSASIPALWAIAHWHGCALACECVSGLPNAAAACAAAGPAERVLRVLLPRRAERRPVRRAELLLALQIRGGHLSGRAGEPGEGPEGLQGLQGFESGTGSQYRVR